MSEPTCSVPGCGRPLRTRGLCNPHYQRLKTLGDVQADRPIRERGAPPSPNATCAVDGCVRRPKGRGWCLMHYQRWQRTGTPNGWTDPGCSFEGCDRPHYGGPGFCRLHYRRWKTHGDALVVLQPPQRLPQPKRPCKVAGCTRHSRAKGMCQQHYAKPFRNRWARAWRKANPDKVRAKDQRRRARLLAAPVNDLTAEQWRDIKAAHKHRCAYCGKRRPLTMDHVIPLSKGGPHTASNIVPACRSCNCSKRDREAPAHQPLLW